MTEIQLGDIVIDRYTGYTGVATARVVYISGCVQYCVEPNNIKEGDAYSGYDKSPYIDRDRLTVITPIHKPISPGSSTGGRQSNTPKGMK